MTQTIVDFSPYLSALANLALTTLGALGTFVAHGVLRKLKLDQDGSLAALADTAITRAVHYAYAAVAGGLGKPGALAVDTRSATVALGVTTVLNEAGGLLDRIGLGGAALEHAVLAKVAALYPHLLGAVPASIPAAANLPAASVAASVAAAPAA